MHTDGGYLEFEENIYLEVNKVLKHMQESGELRVEFDGFDHQYVLQNSSVRQVSLQTVKELNKLFSSANTGMTGRIAPVKDVEKALKIFVNENPEFSDEDIIYATKCYIQAADTYMYGVLKFIELELYNYLTIDNSNGIKLE